MDDPFLADARTLEDVDNEVELRLMRLGYYELARAYVLRREVDEERSLWVVEAFRNRRWCHGPSFITRDQAEESATFLREAYRLESRVTRYVARDE